MTKISLIISIVFSFALFFASMNSLSGQNQSSAASGNNTSHSQNQTLSNQNQSQARSGSSPPNTTAQTAQSQIHCGQGQIQAGQGQGSLANQIQKQIQVNEANQTGRSGCY